MKLGQIPVAGGAVQGFQRSHWLVQAVIILGVIVLGLGLYSRWTGRTFQLDALGRNAIGDNLLVKQAQAASRIGH